jgi:beta-glucosidase
MTDNRHKRGATAPTSARGRRKNASGRAGSAFDVAVAAVRAGADPFGQARNLYEQLTETERLGLLDGDAPFWAGLAAMRAVRYGSRPYVHGEVARLGIPGIRFVDGPRGCVAGDGTAFPVSMGRGATWDTALEQRVGEAIGAEVRAQGGNFYGGVCINLPRHPAWGRVQETYGDDPLHLGAFGAALARGAQRHVMACAKHYALNSMENARFQVDVTIDEGALHEVYLPHFKRLADEGVAGIMSAYNSVNGQWAGQNRYLLTEVLRDRWHWDGITVSDFVFGLRDAAASLDAGLDLEEPFAQQRAQHLRDQIARGETGWEMVERSGLRLLAAQLRHYAARAAAEPGPEVMACAGHRALAREVAARAMVLLKNEPVAGSPVLPMDPAATGHVAVIGRLAIAESMGDFGSSRVHPPGHVTPLEGIRAAFPGSEVTLVEDDDPVRAARAARGADAAVIVVGYDGHDEGEYVDPAGMATPELLALFPPLPPGAALPALDGGDTGMTGGDRASLRLHPGDEELIRSVAQACPRTVVCVVAGGAVIMEAWRHQVPAILIMWYSGMEGGHALADVLTGAHNPSGRLPFSVPASEEHLPFFDRDATSVTYDRFHGQRLLDKLGVAAAYPHGFGLSYTTFAIEEAAAGPVAGSRLTVTARVRNTGDRDGWHVVQVYGRAAEGEHAGENALVGFAAVAVPAGQTAEVAVACSLDPLATWNPRTRQLDQPARTTVALEVAAHAHDPAALTLPVSVP